ncbi:MAG: very short patch repair endonuclease [Spirochaetes bacterium]|nr:very short patch repair endonuclease [Spirochaetota bacterium]
MDHFSKEKRSDIMSKIRSTGTKPEQKVVKWFKKRGYKLTKNIKDLPGKPDIVFKNSNLILFVHGCFWHHHKNCKRATIPKSNKKYWLPKINQNIKRDISTANKLRRLGWHVAAVWECQINKDIDKYLNRIIIKYLNKSLTSDGIHLTVT